MALISIILSLLLDRALRHLHDLRDLSWFEHYTSFLAGFIKKESGLVKLIVVLLLPLSIVLVIQLLLMDLLFGLPYFVFGIFVLLYCLGPACLSSDIEAYLDARSMGDDDEALHYAGSLTERAASTVPDQQTSDVTRAILHVANERIFSVLFWFVVLGPFGAVVYRLVTNISKRDEIDSLAQYATLVQSVVAWIPAHLLAAGYALTGHFDGAFRAYQSRPRESNMSLANHDVLVTTGLGALRGREATNEISSIQAARDLVMRAIIVWIAVLALLTLGGWLG
jgi:membrane protein required for beta-lactamase induction